MTLTITPKPHDYGNILIGDSIEKVFVFSADDVQRINSVISFDSQFIVEAGYGIGEINVPFLVYPGQTEEVTISCAPAAYGAITTDLVIDNEQANYTDENSEPYIDENGNYYTDED